MSSIVSAVVSGVISVFALQALVEFGLNFVLRGVRDS